MLNTLLEDYLDGYSGAATGFVPSGLRREGGWSMQLEGYHKLYTSIPLHYDAARIEVLSRSTMISTTEAPAIDSELPCGGGMRWFATYMP
jgi:hypothetical protein